MYFNDPNDVNDILPYTTRISDPIDTNSIASSISYSSLKVLIEIIIPDHEWKFVFKVPINTLVREFLRRIFTVCRLDTIEYVNYGLYLPPAGMKKGKFLQEERVLSEYPQLCESVPNFRDPSSCINDLDQLMSASEQQLHSSPKCHPTLMLIRKCRYINSLPMGLQKFKQINTKTYQKQLMVAIRSRDLRKMESLLDRGLDPNFQFSFNGQTPLCHAAVQPFAGDIIMKLVEKGAHLEYRDTSTLTALHWAAIKGNLEAIKTLLGLGLNPNVRDNRGLTPLYLAISRDVPTECITMLLYDHAILGVTDDKGRQEIHQVCMADNPRHLEQLILYGADLDAQMANLNTAMHICALNNHEACLRLLLKYGANRDVVNASGQTPYEVALLTGLDEFADLIDRFSEGDVVAVSKMPTYSGNRRASTTGPRAVLEAHLSCRPGSCTSVSLDRNSWAMSVRSPLTVPLLSNGQTPRSSVQLSRPSTRVSDQNSQTPVLRGKRSPLPMLQPKTVILNRGDSGFGFQIRGLKVATDELNDSLKPANQYCDFVYRNSPAFDAGLSAGDYIVEVNGVNVRRASHSQVTDMIVKSGSTVTLKVLTQMRPTELWLRNNVRVTDRRQSVRRSQSVCSRINRPSFSSAPDRSLDSSNVDVSEATQLRYTNRQISVPVNSTKAQHVIAEAAEDEVAQSTEVISHTRHESDNSTDRVVIVPAPAVAATSVHETTNNCVDKPIDSEPHIQIVHDFSSTSPLHSSSVTESPSPTISIQEDHLFSRNGPNQQTSDSTDVRE